MIFVDSMKKRFGKSGKGNICNHCNHWNNLPDKNIFTEVLEKMNTAMSMWKENNCIYI